MLGQVFDDASKFLAKTWLSREASVLPAFGSSQILRPHIHDGSMKIKDVHCALRCWDAEIPWTYLHWRLLATALAGSFLFRMGALESWNSKHPFWELPGLILLLGGKVAVCFSSHNLAVVDWSPHGLHWRTMLCSQQLGGSNHPRSPQLPIFCQSLNPSRLRGQWLQRS